MMLSFVVHAISAAAPATGLYALTAMQDTLIRIDTATGMNTTVGPVALSAKYNPVAAQLSTIVAESAAMYVLALNRSDNVATNVVGISLKDGSIVHEMVTPLFQDNGLTIGVGMTIDAANDGIIVISGVDTQTKKHTAYSVDTKKGFALKKLSDGFLSGAEYALDDAHCLDVKNSIYWLTSPSANYSKTGLFDLVGIDLTKGKEIARHTLPSTGAHALVNDAAGGDLLAVGLTDELKPFAYTVDTVTFKLRIVASLDVYSIFNSISAWDPATRTLYGMAMQSESVKKPVLVSYNAATKAKWTVPLCGLSNDAGACDVPFNFDFFDGSAYRGR